MPGAALLAVVANGYLCTFLKVMPEAAALITPPSLNLKQDLGKHKALPCSLPLETWKLAFTQSEREMSGHKLLTKETQIVSQPVTCPCLK